MQPFFIDSSSLALSDVFEVFPSVTPVFEGERMIIDFKLVKGLLPNVTYFKNGKNLDEVDGGNAHVIRDADGHYQVSFDCASLKDSGDLLMVIEGDTGNVECSIPIVVLPNSNLKIDNLSYCSSVARGHDLEIAFKIQGLIGFYNYSL